MRATDWVLPSWVPTIGRGVTLFGWRTDRRLWEAGVCGGWFAPEADCSRDTLVSAYHLNRSPIQSQVNAAALLILHPRTTLDLGWLDWGERQAMGFLRGNLISLGLSPGRAAMAIVGAYPQKSSEAAQNSTMTDALMYA